MEPGKYCANCYDKEDSKLKYLSTDKQGCLSECPEFQVKKILTENNIGVCLQCKKRNCIICDRDNLDICKVCKYPEYKLDLQTLSCVKTCSNGQYQAKETFIDSIEGET